MAAVSAAGSDEVMVMMMMMIALAALIKRPSARFRLVSHVNWRL